LNTTLKISFEVHPDVFKRSEQVRHLENFSGKKSQISVFVPFLPNRKTGKINTDLFVQTCQSLSDLGYKPVPHIAPRHILNRQEAENILKRLKDINKLDEILLIAGDPKFDAIGEWHDSIEFLQTKLIKDFMSSVLFAGHPDGHNLSAREKIPQTETVKYIREKVEIARSQNLESGLVTQFGSSTKTLQSWLQSLRENHIDIPISIGMMGPSTLQERFKFAQICGLGNARSLLARNPKLLLNLVWPKDNSRQIEELKDLKRQNYSITGCHFYPFVNLKGTLDFISQLNK
jgi:methylenetetrahydrofolate reductase (NADPH)